MNGKRLQFANLNSLPFSPLIYPLNMAIWPPQFFVNVYQSTRPGHVECQQCHWIRCSAPEDLEEDQARQQAWDHMEVSIIMGRYPIAGWFFWWKLPSDDWGDPLWLRSLRKPPHVQRGMNLVNSRSCFGRLLFLFNPLDSHGISLKNCVADDVNSFVQWSWWLSW